MYIGNKLSLFLSLLFLFSSCVSLKTQKELSNEYYNLGNGYFELGNYTKSTDLYIKSLTYNKWNENAVINLIMSYQENKKFIEAEKLISQQYDGTNDDFNKKLIILLGKNYFLLHNYVGAINTFKDYTKSYDEDGSGFYNLGLCYLKIGNNQEAISSFLKSYEIDPTFLPTLFNIVSYYYNEKRYEDTLSYLSELVKKESNNDITMFMYAKILFELKEYENARDSIKKCYEKDSKNSEYYIFAARIYAKGFQDKKNTFYFIEKALENGYKLSDLSNISDFSLMREEYKNEYNEILERVKK